MRAATDRQARVNRGQTQRARALLCGVEVLRGPRRAKGGLTQGERAPFSPAAEGSIQHQTGLKSACQVLITPYPLAPLPPFITTPLKIPTLPVPTHPHPPSPPVDKTTNCLRVMSSYMILHSYIIGLSQKLKLCFCSVKLPVQMWF